MGVPNYGAEEIAQRFKALAALPQALRRFPAPVSGDSQPLVTSSPDDLTPSFALCGHPHACVICSHRRVNRLSLERGRCQMNGTFPSAFCLDSPPTSREATAGCDSGPGRKERRLQVWAVLFLSFLLVRAGSMCLRHYLSSVSQGVSFPCVPSLFWHSGCHRKVCPLYFICN